MAQIDFSKPQRENLLAMLFSAGFLMRKLITAFWPLLLIYVFKGDSSVLFSSSWIYWAIALLATVVAAHSFLSWKYLFFYIKNDEFILEKGYLKKTIISIPIERIVSINTDQKLLHQLLKVVALKIDSTGTENKEIQIRALTRTYALGLREALYNETAQSPESEAKMEKHPKGKTIISLSVLNILKIGITRNHLQALILIPVFIGQLQNQLPEFYQDEIFSTLSETQDSLENSSTFIWISILIMLLTLSLIISIIRSFLNYFDLELQQFQKSFALKSGLIKRKTVTIPFSRVQAVLKQANPLQKWLGIATLQLIQAGSKAHEREKDKVLIPGCNISQINAIKAALMQETSRENSIELRPHWALRNRLFFIKSLLLPPAIILTYFFPYLWWLLLAISLWAITSAQITYKRRLYVINEQFLKIKSGGIVQKEILLEHYKTQAIRLTQTYFQKRRNTASLHLGLAGTSTTLAYIPYEKAIQIKKILEYNIIETSKDWM